jgi:hypothetical protein
MSKAEYKAHPDESMTEVEVTFFRALLLIHGKEPMSFDWIMKFPLYKDVRYSVRTLSDDLGWLNRAKNNQFEFCVTDLAIEMLKHGGKSMAEVEKDAERAAKKLLGINEYEVAVRVTGYYNILIEAESADKAEELARQHNYTYEELSYQGDVAIDDIVEVQND